MISASHNPFADNGVKLLAPGGRKLSDEVEAEVETELHATSGPAGDVPVGGAVGSITAGADATSARYQERVLAALEGRGLGGRRVILDCANGAASAFAEPLFRHAGAEPTVLFASPDGTNINDGCGTTAPDALRAAVRAAGGAAIGFAFDGDADRALAVAEDGTLVDGDQILSLVARDLRARGRLAGDAVVVTVMSNLGFRLAMEDAGIRVVETQVGDRYVLEALAGGGYSLGGEQSGHIIFSDLSTTGDGLLTAVLLADLVHRSGRTLAELARSSMEKLPQVLVNVPVADPRGVVADGAVVAAVRVVEAELAGRGRVLLRPSGTEPLVRVMVEAPTPEAAQAAADRLAAVVALGGRP
jgi:phosphoglucosamine mutase